MRQAAVAETMAEAVGCAVLTLSFVLFRPLQLPYRCRMSLVTLECVDDGIGARDLDIVHGDCAVIQADSQEVGVDL